MKQIFQIKSNTKPRKRNEPWSKKHKKKIGKNVKIKTN